MRPVRFAISSNSGFWFGILVDEKDRLLASAFHADRDSLIKHMAAYSINKTGSAPETVNHELSKVMMELFEGREPNFDPTFNREHITSFQNDVYDVLLEIPKGRVTSYGRIAVQLGSGPRAVGTAVASNPWPLFVPCHRVVPSTLMIGNYSMNGTSGKKSSRVKRQILEREGIRFGAEKIAPSWVWNPEAP